MKRFDDDEQGDVVVGVVDAVVPGGDGIVRDANGVVFVSRALPGEKVRAQVVRRQKRVRHARLLDVLQASPERTKPDCALHESGACGGCDFLDFSRAAQTAAKEQIVRDAVVRIGKLDPAPIAPIRAPGPSASAADIGRRRARFVVHDGAVTFSAKDSHARTPIEACPALHPTLRAALPTLARGVADGTVVNAACDDAGTVSVSVSVDGGARDGAILVGEVTAGAFPFQSDASVFTQATRFGGRAILEEVMAGVGALTTGSGAAQHVLELFAGAGHLTGSLVNGGAVVDAVEGAERSVMFLEKNLASLASLASRASSAAKGGRVRRAYIDETLELPDRVDVVVADPPRTGIPGFAKLLPRVTAKGATRLVLVSCDPATGARDLAAAAAQGWLLEKLVPIDAFPRTAHVEWVATLTR